MKSKNKQNEKLVRLATFENAGEAHCLRIALEEQGIQATVANEGAMSNIGATLFGPISAIFIEVMVLESDTEQALLVKNGLVMADEEAIPEWTCKCGETVDAGFGVCWSCSKPYPSASDSATEGIDGETPR